MLARAFALGSVLFFALPSAPWAHDIPASVMVRAFVKPDGNRLHVIVRVPLEAIRDVKFPLRGPGYLAFGPDLDSLLVDASRTWLANFIQLYEGSTQLGTPRITATLISLPSDRSFIDYESALAHVHGAPLDRKTELAWQQAMLDVALEYEIVSDHSQFSIRPALARLGVRTTTVLRFLPAGGAERAYEYMGDPGLVRLDPRWHQAAWRFIQLGFAHILDGIDHLLFVFCLVIPFRRIRPLIAIVTSFTVAHSITLFASALGYAPSALWFPPLIEVLIALSILYMAFENIVGPKLERRWLIAFGFGLVHGFGFSFALRDSLQFAGTHLVTSLFAFNAGVELGQLFVLALAIPALALLFRYVVKERMGTILLSALVAHTAWHWMIDRGAVLREYDFEWPTFDLALAGAALRALMVTLIIGGVAWALYGLVGRLTQPRSEREPTT
jgi:hypothetical protein